MEIMRKPQMTPITGLSHVEKKKQTTKKKKHERVT